VTEEEEGAWIVALSKAVAYPLVPTEKRERGEEGRKEGGERVGEGGAEWVKKGRRHKRNTQ
jgi:hypothetical protein